MKYNVMLVTTSKGYRGEIFGDGERLYCTDLYQDEGAAGEAGKAWLRWFLDLPRGLAESIYYVLEVPETWAGPPDGAHNYSGLRFKIGRTKNLATRYGNLRTGASGRLIVHALEPGDSKLEAKRHAQFAQDRRFGEWFASSPALVNHVMDVWSRHRMLPPGHRDEVVRLAERIEILRTTRKFLNGPPDMINPSLGEKLQGSVFMDLVYALPLEE